MDRGIARFTDGIADYRPVWQVIEADFYAQVARQFKTEGVAGGDRWVSLSESYGAWKEKNYPGKPILQRTGDLIDSLTNPNSANGVRIEERKTLTLGSTLPYALYHQTGSEDGKHPPRRPEIQLTEAFKRTTMAHVQGYLLQIATQSGFRTGRAPGTIGPPSWQSGAEWRKVMAGGIF
jgi:phage gpG-like protein